MYFRSGNQVFLFRSPLFWFSLPIAIFLALLPRFLYKAISAQYWPTDIDILKEIRRANPKIDFQREKMASFLVSESLPPSQTTSRSYTHPMQVLGNPRGSIETARRSVTDMSLGGIQSTNRGFDFASEEGGPHIRRMQSNLSESRMRALDAEGAKSDPLRQGTIRRTLGLLPSLRRSVRRKKESQTRKATNSSVDGPASQ